MGIGDGDLDIQAGSICELRRLFEQAVDEFLHRNAQQIRHRASTLNGRGSHIEN